MTYEITKEKAGLFQPDQHHRQHQDEGQGHPPPSSPWWRGISTAGRKLKQQLHGPEPVALLRGDRLPELKRVPTKP
ncbi:MAG: hypothetical protein MZV70_48620 [Desulfobacterales bacterium]|nr:hypothetical protein [Desulfobacterales bacterium]